MKRMTKIIVFIMSVLLLCCSFGNDSVEASGVSVVIDQDWRMVSIPTVYDVETTYKNLEEYGFLNHAEDLFMDTEDNLYVADTGNNRILKVSSEGIVVAEYKEGFGVAFKNPKGVYVHTDGSIWVADTDNFRIVRLNQDGSDFEVYYKPKSELLEESFTFAPEKIYVSNTGYIYVLKGNNLMKMDSQNEFRGYVGAAAVPFSFQRLLIRMFGSKSQIERTLKQEPSAYNNFMIGSDGMIYGLLSNDKKGKIRRLNSVGTNTYPESEYYGWDITIDDTIYTVNFSDITVLNNGILTLTDRNTGMIYQYDQEGDLLNMFGGLGERKGVYQNPVSIVSDSNGKLYVLDYTTNTVTVLAPTQFIQLVHKAVALYNEGKYAEAKSYWEQVLEIDSNYGLAHCGYAKVLYKERKYEEAMDEYSLGGDREGYSVAFADYRHDIFRRYFGWICLATILLLGGFWIGFKRVQKYANKLAHKIEYGGWLE